MNFPTFNELQNEFDSHEYVVYFATSDKKNQYFGFDLEDEFIENNTQKLKEWLVNQDKPVFGGFCFDNQVTKNSILMNGYFFTPKTVYDINEKFIYGKEIDINTLKTKQSTKARIIKQIDDDDWLNRIKKPISIMQNDKTKQKVVLGRQRTLILDKKVNLNTLITDLNEQQPNAYHLILKRKNEVFVCATPERIVAVEDKNFATAGVAGTINRGKTAVEDEILAKQLLNDPKNLKEHAYVVDTIKDRLANLVDLNVPDKPIIMKNPQLQHLYTPISGNLKAKSNIIDLVLNLHPTPALGGKPLDFAMNTIKEIELLPRGLFASPVGVLLPNGNGEFVVGIRAMILNESNAQLFAGAGILADSNAKQEFLETGLKMTPMMNLFRG